MKQITAILEGFGSTIILLVRSLSYFGTLPRQWYRFVEQCYLIGYTTLPIVAILCFFIGSVLALQAGYSMENFGTKQFIGTLVGLSMARELDMTRLDYNELTSRLRQQVCDLLDAKMELTALNETLESKVAQRTAELEAANASLVKALDDLQRTQAELVRTAQLAGLGTLVAGVAHELNTPIGNGLTIVTTLAHETRVMKSGYEEGRLKRSMLDTYIRNVEDIYEVLERNLVRAGDIVSHFKQLSVDQASDVRRRFVLSDVVRDTMTAISPRIRKTPYRVVLELESGIEMDSYPGTISQILANFITNALAHAFDGRTGGSMTIRSATMEEDMVELSFIDDGNGIPEEVLQHVFEPFFTTRFGQGGSGLGLYVVYNQVHKLLGGRIDVASEPGCGTTFRLLLPIIACRSAEIHSLPLCGTR